MEYTEEQIEAIKNDAYERGHRQGMFIGEQVVAKERERWMGLVETLAKALIGNHR